MSAGVDFRQPIMDNWLNMSQSIRHQMSSRAYRASNELRNASQEVLRGRRSGRRYIVPGTGRVDSDKNHISFPYTPTADISLFDSSAEHEIYQLFEIDQEEYPYLFMCDVGTTDTDFIFLADSLRFIDGADGFYYTGKYAAINDTNVDYTNVWTVAKSIVDNSSPSVLTDVTTETGFAVVSSYVYLNEKAYELFSAHAFTTTPTYYRLDE